jgi:hypothetical protein
MNKIMKTLTIWAILSLLVVGLASAQPQAPITWGEARWFGIGCHSSRQSLASMGDTLLVADYSRDSTRPNYPRYAIVTTSLDNGLTWSPWHRLNDSAYVELEVCVAASNGWLYAFVNGGGWYEWVYRSQDGGANWNQSFYRQGVYFGSGFASSVNVFCVSREPFATGMEIRRCFASSNSGETWNTGHEVTRQRIGPGYNDIALTHTKTMLGGEAPTDSIWDYRLFCSFGDLEGDNFCNFQQLPGQPLGWDPPVGATIAGDTSSETAIIASAWYPGAGFSSDLYVHRSTDGGATWEEPLALTDDAPIYFTGCPEIFCRGQLWGVAWGSGSSFADSTFTIRCRISANHGKNWYLLQQVDSLQSWVMYTGGQFTENEIRLYWSGEIRALSDSLDYRTASGVITPDTLRPTIWAMEIAPDTVQTEHVIPFAVRVEENDTLSEVRVRMRSDQDSTWVLAMRHQAGDSFAVRWTVPREGHYRYRIEAEDFWENVGSYPDTGWASFVTEHWSSTETHLSIPESYDAIVFPNPSNGWPNLTLSAAWFSRGTLTVTVYNLVGQEVSRNVYAGNNAGTFRLEAPAGTGSGVFIVEIANRDHCYRQKVMILK